MNIDKGGQNRGLNTEMHMFYLCMKEHKASHWPLSCTAQNLKSRVEYISALSGPYAVYFCVGQIAESYAAACFVPRPTWASYYSLTLDKLLVLSSTTKPVTKRRVRKIQPFPIV